MEAENLQTAEGIDSILGSLGLDRPPTPDKLWASLCSHKLDDGGDGVASALCLVDEALCEEIQRLELMMNVHQAETSSHACLSTSRGHGAKSRLSETGRQERLSYTSRSSSPAQSKDGDAKAMETGTLRDADLQEMSLPPLLDLSQGMEGLSRFLEASSTFWYRELGGQQLLVQERRALWDRYSAEWLQGADGDHHRVRPPGRRVSEQHVEGVSLPLLGSLLVGSPEAVRSAYIEKTAGKLQGIIHTLFEAERQGMQHSEAAIILRSLRRVDLCQRVLLDELRADLPLLTGRSACLLNAFDTTSLVDLIDAAFLKVIRDDVISAITAVCNAQQASAMEEGPHGLPMFFYDQEASVVDAPYLNEEILVMLWDDEGALRSGRTRWWMAQVVDSPTFNPSLTRRRASLGQSHEGPLVQIRETGERPHLRGSFYLRHELVDVPGMLDKLKVGDRVLLRDEQALGVYYEGMLVKITVGTRAYGVRLDNADAAHFVPRDMLLPGSVMIHAWSVLSGMVRSAYDVPMKVHEAIVGPSSRRKRSRHSRGSTGLLGTTAARSPDRTSRSGSSHSTTTIRHEEPDLLLPTLLLDQTLGTELAAAWVTPMGGRLDQLRTHLLFNMSRIFKGRAVGLHMPVGPDFQAAGPIAALRPIFSDIAHFLSLCIIGCHGLRQPHELSTSPDPSPAPSSPESPSPSSNASSSSAKDMGTTATSTRRNLVQQLAKLRRTLTEKKRLLIETGGMAAGVGDEQSSSGQEGAKGDLRQVVSGLSEPAQMLASTFSGVLNGLFLEMRRMVDTLRQGMSHLRFPSEMRLAGEILTVAAFLRRTWSLIAHRLDELMLRFQVSASLTTAFSTLIWPGNGFVDEMVLDFLAHLSEINTHWCRAYLFPDIVSHDWQSHKTFLQDKRSTYGVQAWSLFVRGLVFDFKATLFNPLSSSEGRELLSTVLARSLPSLVGIYLGVRPSRTRLGQYVSDLGCVLVTSLVLLDLLRSCDSTAVLGANNLDAMTGTLSGPTATFAAYKEMLPVSNRLWESNMHPHDASHQSTLANLVVVERYCNLLLGMIALLQAPAGLVAWYIRLLSNSTSEAATGAAPPEEEPPPEEQDAAPPSLGPATGAINDCLVNIDIQSYVEAFQASLELGEVFNVIHESQKLGADRDVATPTGEDEAAGEGAGVVRRSTSSAGPGMFSEYFISHLDLMEIKLRWKEVFLTRQPMTKDQVVDFVKRRYEMCNSPYPPLTAVEQARQTMLYEAMGVYDLLTDLQDHDKASECLQS